MENLIELRGFLIDINKIVNSSGRWNPFSGSDSENDYQRICHTYSKLVTGDVSQPGSVIDIPYYDGKNKNVLSIIQNLKSINCDNIESIILQGSLATGEEIAYSDFDAMVILSDDAFKNKNSIKIVVKKLQLLSRHFTDFDLIQHHGWFVTTHKLLQSHFEDFFPFEIFKYSKILYPHKSGETLSLQLIRDKNLFYRALKSNVEGILSEINSNQHVKNLYHLKSTLSKFMLLPALYIQLKEGKGIYKKSSFTFAKTDFSSDEWAIMDQISAIRDQWKQDIPFITQRVIKMNPKWSRQIAKRLAPKLDQQLMENIISKSPKMLTFAKLVLEKGDAIYGSK